MSSYIDLINSQGLPIVPNVVVKEVKANTVTPPSQNDLTLDKRVTQLEERLNGIDEKLERLCHFMGVAVAPNTPQQSIPPRNLGLSE